MEAWFTLNTKHEGDRLVGVLYHCLGELYVVALQVLCVYRIERSILLVSSLEVSMFTRCTVAAVVWTETYSYIATGFAEERCSPISYNERLGHSWSHANGTK